MQPEVPMRHKQEGTAKGNAEVQRQSGEQTPPSVEGATEGIRQW